MVRQWGWLLLVVSGMAGMVGEIRAAAPIYAPYGAWRGRIRYAEGPLGGVRTRVRWTNGLTPVGAQALTQLGTIAGTVFTNATLLSALKGGEDAEAPKSAEPMNSELIELNDRIASNNESLKKDVDALLKQLNLKNKEFQSSPSTASGNNGGQDQHIRPGNGASEVIKPGDE